MTKYVFTKTEKAITTVVREFDTLEEADAAAKGIFANMKDEDVYDSITDYDLAVLDG